MKLDKFFTSPRKTSQIPNKNDLAVEFPNNMFEAELELAKQLSLMDGITSSNQEAGPSKLSEQRGKSHNLQQSLSEITP
jgi:hypothetical protein